ncbi:hypothetical protein SH2C18_34760 [Clostridium sediminicola]
MILIYAIIFFYILYYIVRGAVEEGTLKALRKYDRLKNQENKGE